jgi:hypothetical protein
LPVQTLVYVKEVEMATKTDERGWLREKCYLFAPTVEAFSRSQYMLFAIWFNLVYISSRIKIA